MAEANDVYRSIYQNLIDAGCDQQTAEQCMVFAKEGRFTDILPILVRHRKVLLGSLHESQKQIDCLDYLLYKIKNRKQEDLKMSTTLPKIALGAWSWGAGAAGGDQVFGNHLFEEELKPVFEKAVECGLNLWDTAAVYGEGTSERILDYCKENGITFYSYMVLEQGALTGRYNETNPFPEGTGRGEAYNPHLKELTALIDEMKMIGTRFDASPAQIATAWAIAKGTLPIIGVTKVNQVEEAAKAAQIELTADEISRLERLGDETGVHTLREWEKEM